MVVHRVRIEAVNLEDIGYFAAFFYELGVHLRELAFGLADLDFFDPGHAWTLPRMPDRE